MWCKGRRLAARFIPRPLPKDTVPVLAIAASTPVMPTLMPDASVRHFSSWRSLGTTSSTLCLASVSERSLTFNISGFQERILFLQSGFFSYLWI